MGNAEGDIDLHNVTVKGSKYAPTKQEWLYGGTLAAPTWKAYMDEALKGEPNEAFPSPDQSLVGQPKKVTPPRRPGTTTRARTRARAATTRAISATASRTS
ncbi:hypothetical protein GCM10025864_08350 [Luteimicrobium album]|uniref:Penicillin-binding protein 1A n=1 Tax=Luteimicrobium album TaxID=1054550 RepID=A0ABQ6HX95_9MICO|nr:hypothetical protein [Luteimicrobium album]GMA23076.1 hypothetical protein GCM10025864_08350 [Luteimicrobium album]